MKENNKLNIKLAKFPSQYDKSVQTITCMYKDISSPSHKMFQNSSSFHYGS